MNKTAELVSKFAAFDDKYPDASLEDFARYLVAKEKTVTVDNADIRPDTLLAKVIGRIMRLNTFYANLALKSIGLGGLEEYTYLLSIQLNGDPMKTELINQNFHELSSGLLIIGRLIKKALIAEKNDPADRRSKRISLTKAGLSKLNEAKKALAKVSHLFFDPIGDDDIRFCIGVLAPVEKKFAALWLSQKGKSFPEIMAEMEN
jgi:DNA-binding MarR family transcriptional regulator